MLAVPVLCSDGRKNNFFNSIFYQLLFLKTKQIINYIFAIYVSYLHARKFSKTAKTDILIVHNEGKKGRV